MNEQPTQKIDLREKLLNQWSYYKAGQYVQHGHLDDFQTALENILSEIEALCGDAASPSSMRSFLMKIKEIALIGQKKEESTTINAAKSMILGSLIQLLQTGHYLYRRAEEGREEEFMSIFKRELLPFIQEFKSVSQEFIEEAREGLPS